MVDRALETASTFEGDVEASCGGSLGFDGGSLLGGLVAYVRTIVYLGRRSRDARGVRVPRVVYVRAHRCGSRRDHLAAGSILGAFAMPRKLYVMVCE
jgi:hypothetical protein